jgi:hypothetical protein
MQGIGWTESIGCPIHIERTVRGHVNLSRRVLETSSLSPLQTCAMIAAMTEREVEASHGGEDQPMSCHPSIDTDGLSVQRRTETKSMYLVSTQLRTRYKYQPPGYPGLVLACLVENGGIWVGP